MNEANPYRVGAERNMRIIASTTNALDGYRVVEYLGIVRGIVVRTPSFVAGIVGAFKAIGGGNIKEFSDVCEAARHEAYEQMVAHAEQMGAHAILAMHYDATEFGAGQGGGQGATEVLAYGTAVRIQKV
jgi:uncharacterized protein YbjQ (UPF0145 family)